MEGTTMKKLLIVVIVVFIIFAALLPLKPVKVYLCGRAAVGRFCEIANSKGLSTTEVELYYWKKFPGMEEHPIPWGQYLTSIDVIDASGGSQRFYVGATMPGRPSNFLEKSDYEVTYDFIEPLYKVSCGETERGVTLFQEFNTLKELTNYCFDNL